MKTKLLSFVFFFFLSPVIYAQFISKVQLTAGGTGSDVAQQISDVVNGSVFIGASSNSNKSKTKSENSKGDYDYWVTKFSVNKNGTVSRAWDRTIGGSKKDDLKNVFATRDGGCLLAGNSFSGISGDKTDTVSHFFSDTWLVKLDKDGNIQWQKTIYNTNYNMSFWDIDGIPGGGFIMLSSMGLTKLDAMGNIIWVQPPQPGYGYLSVKHTTGGGFIMAISNPALSIGLTKTDSNGIAVWTQVYGSNLSVKPNDRAIQTSDGGYALYGVIVKEDYDGEVYYYAEDRYLYKTDSLGKFTWGVGDFDPDGYGFQAGLAETNDGGFLFGSSAWYYPQPGIYNVEKINKNGIKIWEADAPGISNDILKCIVRVSANSYLLGGSTSDVTEEHPLPDVYVVGITDTTVQNAIASNSIASAKQMVNFNVYPNPAKDILFIQSSRPVTLTLINAIGKIYSTITVDGKSQLNISRMPSGIYYLKNVATGVSEKIIITK